MSLTTLNPFMEKYVINKHMHQCINRNFCPLCSCVRVSCTLRGGPVAALALPSQIAVASHSSPSCLLNRAAATPALGMRQSADMSIWQCQGSST